MGIGDLSAGIEDYWSESSLKISPVEQVILLSELLENKWEFEEKNIQAIKDALFISDTSIGKLYGKTGTGSLNGQIQTVGLLALLNTVKILIVLLPTFRIPRMPPAVLLQK